MCQTIKHFPPVILTLGHLSNEDLSHFVSIPVVSLSSLTLLKVYK